MEKDDGKGLWEEGLGGWAGGGGGTWMRGGGGRVSMGD